MTFQPPPPQGPQGSQSPQNMPPQGPPPAGQWGPPPGQPARPGGSFDPKTVNQLDWGILAAGVLAFIFSFVSYYTFSDRFASVSENAWHGFFGWFAMLLALVGSAVVALEIFMPHVKLPFPNRLIALGAYALATLCVILALFIIPGYLGIDVPSSVDEGHGFGYWVSLIVIIAGLVLSFMRFQQTGGQLPIGSGASRGFGGVGGSGGHSAGSSGMGGHGMGGHSAPSGPPPGAPAGPPPSAPSGPPPGYAPPSQGQQPPPPPGYGAPPPQGSPTEQGQYGQQPPPPPSH